MISTTEIAGTKNEFAELVSAFSHSAFATSAVKAFSETPQTIQNAGY
jgi:hypothetical protein